MSEDITRKTLLTERRKRAIGLGLLAVIAPITVSFLVLLYNYLSDPVQQAIANQEPLFVFHALTTPVLFGLVSVVLVFAYAIFENLGKWLARPSTEPLLNKILVACYYGAIFSCVAMLFGAPVFNWFWHDHFEEQGYSQCDSGVFSLKAELVYSVWVQDPVWCEDPQVSKLLKEEGISTSGLTVVGEYIKKSYGNNPEGGNDETTPPLRGSANTD